MTTEMELDCGRVEFFARALKLPEHLWIPLFMRLADLASGLRQYREGKSPFSGKDAEEYTKMFPVRGLFDDADVVG